jgi:uncharacterized membrane protein
MNKIINKLKNPGTLIGVVSATALLVKEFGFDVDLGQVDTIINLVCTIGIALGILNNPDTPGIS